MQRDPFKTVANYNELNSSSFIDRAPLPRSVTSPELPATLEQIDVISTGQELVNRKVNEILGYGNSLTGGVIDAPKTRFLESDSDHPSWLGYFTSAANEIVIITGKAGDRLGHIKVYVHEFLHFLSHNGRDDAETVTDNSPIASKNNVGFRRTFGLDIREGREGQQTGDYFLAFNEAVTEQLAIDILPGVLETYGDYRDLLNQVIDDAMARGLGSRKEGGAFQPWSKEQLLDYVYNCFFRGDLEGFTGLLQSVYEKYGLSAQQFGLMTHKDDLPTVIEAKIIDRNPDTPPPSPSTIARVVQQRLNSKTAADYLTDVVEPEDIFGAEYDSFVEDNQITIGSKEIINGREYEIDSLGYVVYKGSEASVILERIKAILQELISSSGYRNVDDKIEDITEKMDELLFQEHVMSMISDGFREFYIHKHRVIDRLRGR